MAERRCPITGRVCVNECKGEFCVFEDSMAPCLERADFLKQAILSVADSQEAAEVSFSGLISREEIQLGAERAGVTMHEFTKVLLKKYLSKVFKPNF